MLRDRQRIDAIAVFKRDGRDGEWKEGKTAYVFDMPDGIDRKRAELLTRSAMLRWLEV